MAGDGDPMDGQVLLLAAAKASVSPQRLPDLVDLAQAHLTDRLAEYQRAYEVAFDEGDRVGFFVEADHWDELGGRLGFTEQEADALRRVHGAQLRRIGTDTDRRDEFEAALDIREAVVIGR
ncbi:hypothetical protein [Haloglomus halophilum]|uniref:hypothetical protein n=1 Tax=Haloglomus halophilum TaxID=2962672 RepID=UPI0020C9B15F|nr:hypothetical protein [Haloglomus halophilum]